MSELEPNKTTMIVETEGGIVNEVFSLVDGRWVALNMFETIDWDAFSDGDTEEEWDRLSEVTQEFIKTNRPQEYEDIMNKIEYLREERK